MSNTKSKSHQPHQQNGQSVLQINKQSEPIPPQYQPPPQPSGILKNNPHFNSNTGAPTSGLISPNLIASGPLGSNQSGQIRGKDGQGKLSPKIDFVTASKNPALHSTAFYPSKVPQGQFLSPNSQYPPASVAPTQVTNRSRISDDEFLRLGPVEMLKFVRKTESDIARLAAEQNRQIQTLVICLSVT